MGSYWLESKQNNLTTFATVDRKCGYEGCSTMFKVKHNRLQKYCEAHAAVMRNASKRKSDAKLRAAKRSASNEQKGRE